MPDPFSFPTSAEALAALLQGRPEPILVRIDDRLYRLRCFREDEWAALPPDRRPHHAVFRDGLGWVAAEPAPELNN